MVLLLSVRCRFAIIAGLLLLLAPDGASAAEDRHAAARALLVARCVECHGEDSQEGGLRLDSRGSILRGGEYGPIAIAGNGTEGELLDRIRTADADDAVHKDCYLNAPTHTAEHAVP